MIPANYFLRLRQDPVASPLLLDNVLARESAGVRHALGFLRGLGHTQTAMAATITRMEGPEPVARLFYWLTRFQQAGQLEYILRLSDGSDARLVPTRPGRPFGNSRFDPAGSYIVSRFALQRRRELETQLESPLCATVVRFTSWIPAAVLALFGRPASCNALLASLPGKAASDILPLAELFVVAGFFEEAGSAPEPPARALWEPHDLLFHERSTTPRLGEPFAAVFPHRQPEPPALKPAFPGAGPIELPPPALEKWLAGDPPLAKVMAARRSATSPGPCPPSLAQVAEFLFRTAHCQPDGRRVLPGAGARNELEFYVLVHEAEGLPPGFYHYHASSHRLCRLNSPAALDADLLRRAGQSWSTGRHHPHLVIVVATRFARMASRYASIAYRNAILDAGIAIEAMYLNAAAMGMAPCALGINLPDLFARMTGLDPFEETSLALFALSA